MKRNPGRRLFTNNVLNFRKIKMKRTLDQSFGSRQSAFEPVQRRPRMDAPAFPSTLPPGGAHGYPVIRSIAQRSPVTVVWQSSASSSSALPQCLPHSSPSVVAHQDRLPDFIAAKANELHAAIFTENPVTSEIASATDAHGKNALFHAIEKMTFSQ